MKVQFDGNGFSAEMGNAEPRAEMPKLQEKMIKKSMGMVLGIISLVAALATLLLGFIGSTSADLLYSVLGSTPVQYILTVFVICFVIAAVSIACGVAAIVSYAKSEKETMGLIGMIFAIVSFVVCLIALIVPLITVALL